jgi:hypothetical protein
MEETNRILDSINTFGFKAIKIIIILTVISICGGAYTYLKEGDGEWFKKSWIFLFWMIGIYIFAKLVIAKA